VEFIQVCVNILAATEKRNTINFNAEILFKNYKDLFNVVSIVPTTICPQITIPVVYKSTHMFRKNSSINITCL